MINGAAGYVKMKQALPSKGIFAIIWNSKLEGGGGMPEGKISREKLKDHFRRLWAVYLAGIVLLCFLNNVVYDVTRPAYSDAETLKILLVNADAGVDEEGLLADVRGLDFKAVETLPLAVQKGDPTSEMLLFVQLTEGSVDICIADEAGYELLLQRDVCLHTEAAGREYMVVLKNGTNIESAQAALEPLMAQMGWKK